MFGVKLLIVQLSLQDEEEEEVIIITSGGADGADDRRVGSGVGEVESRILHRVDPDVDVHDPLAVRGCQAPKKTGRHLLNLAVFVPNHDAGVS